MDSPEFVKPCDVIAFSMVVSLTSYLQSTIIVDVVKKLLKTGSDLKSSVIFYTI